MADRERRRRGTRVLVLIGLVALLVVAAFLWPRATRGPLDVPTGAAVTTTGVLRGELDAARSGDHVCYSIVVNGSTAVLRFEPGWSADTRLGLRDPSGAVAAQPGDTLVLLGVPATIGSVAGCTQRGRIWTVHSVRQRIVP